jgi:putative hydrolase of the HAD superfamily
LRIQALLIDADGVIQYAPTDWTKEFCALLGSDDLDEQTRFSLDIWAAETATLTRPHGFMGELTLALAKWSQPEKLKQIVDVMLSIHPYEDNLQLFQGIRRAGIKCYIASNQQASRARYMSEILNYRFLFDEEFYSCFVGAAKPGQQFFKSVLSKVGLEEGSILFIDDREENVEGARRLGFQAALYHGTQGVDALRTLLTGFGLPEALNASVG